MRLRQRLRRDDSGVTLIELLVTVTLLGIILVPLTNATIMYLRNTDAINDRLAASHDAQIAAAYFAQDVQSVGLHDWATDGYPLRTTSVELNAAADTGNRCKLASGTTPNALVRLAWDAPTTASGIEMVVVSYVVKQDGAEKQLLRLRCNASGTVLEKTVVAHNLDSDPVVTTTGTPVPQSISMVLNIRVQGSTNQILNVKLYGQRRQS